MTSGRFGGTVSFTENDFIIGGLETRALNLINFDEATFCSILGREHWSREWFAILKDFCEWFEFIWASFSSDIDPSCNRFITMFCLFLRKDLNSCPLILLQPFLYLGGRAGRFDFVIRPELQHFVAELGQNIIVSELKSALIVCDAVCSEIISEGLFSWYILAPPTTDTDLCLWIGIPLTLFLTGNFCSFNTFIFLGGIFEYSSKPIISFLCLLDILLIFPSFNLFSFVFLFFFPIMGKRDFALCCFDTDIFLIYNMI